MLFRSVQLADRLGVADRVDFVGMIPIERKLDYFRRCIAYVQPSLYEGFGVAIAEAASIGCPIVATGRGAIPEVCGPDAALLGPGDIEGIALAMSSLVGRQRTHPDEMQRHRWIAKRYDIAIRRKLIAEVIASVL